MRSFYSVLLLFGFLSCIPPSAEKEESTVTSVMDDVITRLYAEVSPDQYDHIDDRFILDFLTEEERQVLATQYQYFTVNVPVVVSLMRHQDQKTIPFWLEDAGFKKTASVVKSESYTYEVWQKHFDAGKIELGINGFDKHRPVYFISVGPQNEKNTLRVTDVYPSAYDIINMKEGAFTYHDWSDLKLIEVPESLSGQKLFTTVRGRAREAHIVNAFRKTPYPSAKEPDQVMLTWSEDPKTTLDIQWRTDTSVHDGTARFWRDIVKGTDTLSVAAASFRMQDRMLMNDRYINRFTATLRNLQPGATYRYQVGSPHENVWSDVRSFTTAADTQKFSFVWFGDTHCFPDSGQLISLAKRHADASFYSIAGDIVSTGLNRDDWDRFFEHSRDAFGSKPLMPVPGNHDRQDGLGAKMYYDLFSLPTNGPRDVDTESSYYFEYGNALFLMIDATSDVNAHTAWIEETLAKSNAVWKFAIFHFPPYNFEEPYPEIQQAWVPLFDRYHVDMVMGGHIHYYMRSQPMRNGKVVSSFNDGTVYTISISIPANHETIGEEAYAATRYPQGYFYQHMEIDGDVMRYTAYDENGVESDRFIISKKRASAKR